MGTMHVEEWIDVKPECVGELVDRFGDRSFPQVSSNPKKGCPDDQAYGNYVFAIYGKMDIPEDEIALLEKHFRECDPCMIALMNVYSSMMVNDNKFAKRLLAEEYGRSSVRNSF